MKWRIIAEGLIGPAEGHTLPAKRTITVEGGDMVVVKISETYDLNTRRDKVGLLGIHTPAASLIAKLWSGFFTNYKFVRILSGSVTCACASYLPADPLQVGTESGKVAPQDMFNPILYKAVSNDSYETVVSALYGNALADRLIADGSVNKKDIYPGDQSDPDNPYDQFELYYGLLAQPGWRKAMPQAGFSMKGLKPYIHNLASTFGNVSAPSTSANPNLNSIYGANDQGLITSLTAVGRVIRGKAFPMPRMPTKLPSASVANVDIPPVWCAAIIVPPSKLNSLYYRLRVVWYVEFSVPRNSNEFGNFTNQATLGTNTYYNSYDSAKGLMEKSLDSVDSIGIEIDKVMEN